MRPVQLFALAFILSACGRETPETGARGSGSELEAPRLIPAVRNQLDLMSSSSRNSTENMTAYKNLTSDLVTSMQADLYRVGFADSGQFRALSDSVLVDLGGGSGTPATGPEPSEVKEHVARMRRLLNLYQQTMKGAANKL